MYVSSWLWLVTLGEVVSQSQRRADNSWAWCCIGIFLIFGFAFWLIIKTKPAKTSSTTTTTTYPIDPTKPPPQPTPPVKRGPPVFLDDEDEDPQEKPL